MLKKLKLKTRTMKTKRNYLIATEENAILTSETIVNLKDLLNDDFTTAFDFCIDEVIDMEIGDEFRHTPKGNNVNTVKIIARVS